jgi:uncharacterized protein (TIGR03067 family)
MRRGALAAWAVVLLAVGCQQRDDATRHEPDELRGTWKLEEMVIDGKAVDDQEIKQTYSLSFEEGRYVIRASGRVQSRGAYKADPAANPKSLDISPFDGEDAGRTLLGIYKEEGGVLTVCVRKEDRPTQFFGEEEHAGMRIVLKREK